MQRIDSDHGRLDVLVNDIWGGELLFDWKARLWEHDLNDGLRLLRLALDTHLITSHHALPLLIRRPGGLVVEMTDGTTDYNATRYRVSAFYDLAKAAVLRLAWGQGHELAEFGGTAVAITPGWMRSEIMLDHHGVSEYNWRDARRSRRPTHFGISETPTYHRASRGRTRRRSGSHPVEPGLAFVWTAGARIRLHRCRRQRSRRLALHGRGPGRGQTRGRHRLSVKRPAGGHPACHLTARTSGQSTAHGSRWARRASIAGSMASLQREPLFRKIRCSCESCGSHVLAYGGVGRLSGSCGTCGSRELTPLARREHRARARRAGLAV